MCDPECLVRLPGGDATVALLARYGVTPSYAGEGVTWTTLPASFAQELAEQEVAFKVLDEAVETLPLYLVRLPEGGDDAIVRAMGEVIDESGGDFIVQLPGPPPAILPFVDARIAIEKFPPARSTNRGDMPSLADPWDPAGIVSAAEIESTIADLQTMGAGDQLGTRHYTTLGNLEVAEYLFRRMADYGLSVRYEDFIADNGTLALNVVGEIAGRDPNKPYLLTAHFDSIASDTIDNSVAPGALDNASGVATLLEAARVLSGYNLSRSVQIVFLNAEEVGLQGAEAFAKRAVSEGRTYAGAMNVDSVGALLSTNRLVVNADDDSLWIQEILVSINTLNSGLGIDLWPRQNPVIVADDTRLSQAGIPTVLLASVVYGDPLINQSHDTLDNVDPFRVQRVTQLVVLSLGSLLVSTA